MFKFWKKKPTEGDRDPALETRNPDTGKEAEETKIGSDGEDSGSSDVDAIEIPAPIEPAGSELVVANADSLPSNPVKKTWRERLAGSIFNRSIGSLFARKPKLDDALLDELETALLGADVGVTATTALVEGLRKRMAKREFADADAMLAALRGELVELLVPVAQPLRIDATKQPFVILMVGVNGVGKTTTIGKLARRFQTQGHGVVLAAGDTFRAAAVEQLKVWGDRAGVPVIAKQTGADAAGLAYEALEKAKAERCDVLLIDTAGRLHNKANLMEELAKIVRVIRKLDPDAPQSCLLVLDATVGQNAHAQVETFKSLSPVDALVLTKLDGSAKGGVLVALAERFKLPVVAIGVGEGIDDLRPFEARAFARSLMGLPS